MRTVFKRIGQLLLLLLAMNMFTWYVWGERRFFEKVSIWVTTDFAKHDFALADSTYIISPYIGTGHDAVFADFNYETTFPNFSVRTINSQERLGAYFEQDFEGAVENWYFYGAAIHYDVILPTLAFADIQIWGGMPAGGIFLWCIYDWIHVR